ncbi:hypothetical protein DPMN_034994 [Dreissena polymorpha]|uniref:Uncharacterized protein n=1 Tax=Dreissena polymorpha TaxID=45954 RepID=A0A9D4M8P0_DREPO|nr:hypothetical protein DPMN_034994 [Dreissena polymorpha]
MTRFQANLTIIELVQDIIETNLLTKFHVDRKIMKNAPLPGGHVFQPTDIIGMNLLMLTRFYYSHMSKRNLFELIQDIIEKNLLTKFHEDWKINVASREKCPGPDGHVFKATKTIFELIQDIIGTNLLTKFHDDRKINVTSRVLTRKMPRPCGGHVFQPTGIIFELFHEDRTINVAKNAPPLGSHVFQANVTIF